MQGRVMSKWNDFSNSNMKTPTPPHPIKIQWKKQNYIHTCEGAGDQEKLQQLSQHDDSRCRRRRKRRRREEEAAIHRANFELLQTLQITHCDEWKSGRVEEGQP
jgi:hypothetical protein